MDGAEKMNEGDTNQPMEDGITEHKSKKSKQGGDAYHSKEEEEHQTDNDQQVGKGANGSQDKNGLDNEQPKDTGSEHNQQNKMKKDIAGTSGQSDAERKACDTSDEKCPTANKTTEILNAGDGLRQRSSNEKKNIAKVGDHVVKTKKSLAAADTFRSHTGWYILLAILLSLLSVVVWWFSRTSPSPKPVENWLERFNQEMMKVKESFPSQHSELWRRSRIHLQKHLNLTDPTEPVSLILTSARVAEKTLSCLAQRLATAFSNVFNSSFLGINGTSKSAQDSDQVKMDIDKALKEAFEGGTMAAVIHRFEELPPGSTLIFYRYCDHENSAFKKVFLAFTVMLEEDFTPNAKLGIVEEMVQEYIKRKFVSSNRTAKFNQMDVDKLGGLWSRISHLILPVASEQKIEQQGCWEGRFL